MTPTSLLAEIRNQWHCREAVQDLCKYTLAGKHSSHHHKTISTDKQQRDAARAIVLNETDPPTNVTLMLPRTCLASLSCYVALTARHLHYRLPLHAKATVAKKWNFTECFFVVSVLGFFGWSTQSGEV